MTVEQFLKLPQKRIELLNGVPVEMPPRFLRESLAVSALFFEVSGWVRERNLGFTTFGCLFQIAPKRLRMPALSYLSHADLRGENLNWIIRKAAKWPGRESKRKSPSGCVVERAKCGYLIWIVVRLTFIKEIELKLLGRNKPSREAMYFLALNCLLIKFGNTKHDAPSQSPQLRCRPDSLAH